MLSGAAITNTRGSLLLEGLLVMSIITALIVIIFSYIRSINDSYTHKINQERATLLITETFEKIHSARDTALNISVRTGWDTFRPAGNEGDRYVLEQTDLGGWQLVREEKDVNEMIFPSEIAPYENYRILLTAHYLAEDTDSLYLEATALWGEAADTLDTTGLTSISQQLVLTNHRLYENLY